MSLVVETNLVSVQLASKLEPGVYVGREYTYIADNRLKEGDVVYVDTRFGGTLAQVVRVNIREYTIPRNVRPILRHITGTALPPEKLPKPQLQAVT
ncbi:MAG: hypothetical protein RR951_09630, partial [Ruthenibacterium sp.]